MNVWVRRGFVLVAFFAIIDGLIFVIGNLWLSIPVGVVIGSYLLFAYEWAFDEPLLPWLR